MNRAEAFGSTETGASCTEDILILPHAVSPQYKLSTSPKKQTNNTTIRTNNTLIRTMNTKVFKFKALLKLTEKSVE